MPEEESQPKQGVAKTADEAPPMSTTPGPIGRLLASWWRISLLAALAAIALQVFNSFEIGALWDDAYIFQRYAQHLTAGHGLAWHPGGEPSYGLTALLYIVPSTLFRLIAGGNPSLGAMLAGTVCGLAFLLLLIRLLWSHTDGNLPARSVALVLVAFCVAWSSTPLHFTTGMDTPFTLGYLVALLILGHRFERRPDRSRAIALGLVGGLAFWIRPELCSFGLAIPAAMIVLGSRGPQRKLAALALGLVVAALGLIALTNWAYFSSVLPLPFYGKSLNLYGGSLRRAYRGVAGQELVDFIGHYWPLFLVTGLEVASRRRAFWRHAPPLDKAVLAATLICLAYYWLLALPIMGMSSRFYQPAVVGLAYLTARALGRWEHQLAGSLRSWSPEAWRVAGCAALFGLWALLMPTLVDEGKVFSTKVSTRGFDFDPYAEAAKKKDGPRNYWYKLDEFAKLPDDLVIATTEVGFLSAINPNKIIIDLAGLNDRAFAQGPFDADLLLGKYRPDLIYMPHEDYKTLTKAILESRQFEGYQYYNKFHTQTRKFGVALRKDSPHFDAMNRLCRYRKGLTPDRLKRIQSVTD